MTITPSHHSVVHQNCLLKGQAIGMSRGFHRRKFTKRRGIIVTHLTLGLRARLLQCKRETFFGFYTIKTLFLQCKTPNRISKLTTQLGSTQVAHARAVDLVWQNPPLPPVSFATRKFCKGTDKRMARSSENPGTDKDRLNVGFFVTGTYRASDMKLLRLVRIRLRPYLKRQWMNPSYYFFCLSERREHELRAQ